MLTDCAGLKAPSRIASRREGVCRSAKHGSVVASIKIEIHCLILKKEGKKVSSRETLVTREIFLFLKLIFSPLF